MTDFPMGATVTFADATATVSDGQEGIAKGIVNGPPMMDDAGGWHSGEGAVFVPLFCERDNGREATTVYVHESNILSVQGGAR